MGLQSIGSQRSQTQHRTSIHPTDRCECVTKRKVLEGPSCTACTSQKVESAQMFIRCRLENELINYAIEW